MAEPTFRGNRPDLTPISDLTASNSCNCRAGKADKQQSAQSTPPPTRHILEDILARRSVRWLLGCLTAGNGRTKSLLERIAENYNRPDQKGLRRWCWRLPEALIDYGLKRAGISKQTMTVKVLHHRPTMRSLTLTGRSIARFGLSTPQRFAAPLMVVWNFTQACNLRCRHCYQNATAKPLPDELTLNEKLRVVDQMGEAGVPFLAIAGGEPLVSRDLWPVLERARQNEIHLTIATNGTLLTPENVKRLIEAGVKYVEVSVDSIDPEEHDEFRGIPGAWQRAVQGIRDSVAGGMRTGFATTFTRHNVHLVDKTIDFAISLGCQTFSHFNFIPVGRGTEMMEDDLTPEQREWLLQRLVDRLQEGRINILSTAPQFGRACVAYAPPEGIFATGHAGSGQGSKTMVLSRYIGGCGAGRCYCAIEPNGDVTPCVYMPSVKAGNLRQASFQQIWDDPLFDPYNDRNDRSGHCRVCLYKVYCGGCRARALAYTGDFRASDPGCSHNRRLWEHLEAKKNQAVTVTIAGSGK